MFVDSHCHLSFPELHDRIDDILSAMAQAQVSRALCIDTTCCTVVALDEQGDALRPALHRLASKAASRA